MPLAFYMDVHVPRAITNGLLGRAVDVLRAQDDGPADAPDTELFDRATVLGRVIVTADADFLIEAGRRQKDCVAFPGVIFIQMATINIGRCIDDLEVIAKAGEAQDLINRVEYLPL